MTAIFAGKALQEDWASSRDRWRRLCEVAGFHRALLRERIGTNGYERLASEEIYQVMIGASGAYSRKLYNSDPVMFVMKCWRDPNRVRKVTKSKYREIIRAVNRTRQEWRNLWSKIEQRTTAPQRRLLWERQIERENFLISKETSRLSRKLNHLRASSVTCGKFHCCWKVARRYQAESEYHKNNIKCGIKAEASSLAWTSYRDKAWILWSGYDSLRSL